MLLSEGEIKRFFKNIFLAIQGKGQKNLKVLPLVA